MNPEGRATDVVSPPVPLSEVAADAADTIRTFRARGSISFHDVPLEEARALYVKACAAAGLFSAPLEIVEDISCPVTGGTILLRHYRARSGPDSSPGLLFIHGGGWTLGGLETHDPICRYLADVSGLPVISVDYRLAPEHRFPTPLQDCVEALAFVRDNCLQLRLDPKKVVVMGDSAGANMATVLANNPACAVSGTKILGQILVYPVVDLSAESASYERITSGFPLSAPTMRWFTGQYLGPGVEAKDPRISPNQLEAGTGSFPPAFLVSLGLDPLGEEGIAYAGYLARHGTRVEHHHLPQHAHGLLTSAGKIPTGREVLDRSLAFIDDLLTDRGSSS